MVLDQTQRIVGVGEVPAIRVTTEGVRRIFQDIPRARAARFISVPVSR